VLSLLAAAATAGHAPIHWLDLGLTRGIDLGFFPENLRSTVDELFVETQPAHLQKGSQAKLAAEERDAVRAKIVREKLADFPTPDVDKPRAGTNGDEETV